MSNTLFVGKVYHRFDELPSTNDWAAKLVARREDASSLNDPEGTAKTKPPEGTVVRAANQTAGRGQLGSRWHSLPEKNLLLSVIFYPTWLEAQAQFYLSMAVALGVHDVIGALGHSSLAHSIKWPNDLLLGNKKTAGILIQNALSGSSLQSSIVGIGLNVNQLNFPPELPHATSLALAGGQKLDLDAVAERLFECLERRYLQLKAGHRGAIQLEYEDQLWRLGEHSRFVRSSTDAEFEGIILGVTERGLLRLETVTGVEEFEVKQLRFVP
jgi:BirA family biotin operon repressor/biotin-[acetyl-CoA-carboxylase] ligase